MSNDMVFQRRQNEKVICASILGEVFTDWWGPAEHEIFLAAHDDDSVVDAGLLVQLAALERSDKQRRQTRRPWRASRGPKMHTHILSPIIENSDRDGCHPLTGAKTWVNALTEKSLS